VVYDRGLLIRFERSMMKEILGSEYKDIYITICKGFYRHSE
jgi:hypothetical protein